MRQTRKTPIGPSQTYREREVRENKHSRLSKLEAIPLIGDMHSEPAFMPHIQPLYKDIQVLSRSKFLPIGQHVLDGAVVLRNHILLDLLLRQPLEVFETLRVYAQVGLSGEDAALHKEGLLAQQLDLGLLVDLRFPVIVDEVADRVVADEPGVHVDAGRFGQSSFCGLERN